MVDSTMSPVTGPPVTVARHAPVAPWCAHALVRVPEHRVQRASRSRGAGIRTVGRLLPEADTPIPVSPVPRRGTLYHCAWQASALRICWQPRSTVALALLCRLRRRYRPRRREQDRVTVDSTTRRTCLASSSACSAASARSLLTRMLLISLEANWHNIDIADPRICSAACGRCEATAIPIPA